MDEDDRIEIIKRHVTMLREHFDSIEVVASRHVPEEGGAVTTRFEWGSGPWYERFGLMRAWVIRKEQEERETARRSMEE